MIGTSDHRDRLIFGILVIASALWMVRSHWESVDEPKMEYKQRLHGQVLANEAPDPYQYKLWLISHGFDTISSATGADLDDVFYANTLLSILFFMLLHHLWLHTYVPEGVAAIGGIVIAALSLTLFRGYFHHPYEFWGLGLFCLLLRGIQREWPIYVLAGVGLVTGLVWEKHALLAPLWGLYRLLRKDAFWPAFAKGIFFLVACLAIPLLVRWHLDGLLPEGVARDQVDGDTPLSVQKWHLVLWYQGAYILPFLMIAALRWRVLPLWVRLNWAYLPVLVGLYLAHDYIIHETRSFYALAPVFTATLCAWFAARVLPREG